MPLPPPKKKNVTYFLSKLLDNSASFTLWRYRSFFIIIIMDERRVCQRLWKVKLIFRGA